MDTTNKELTTASDVGITVILRQEKILTLPTMMGNALSIHLSIACMTECMQVDIATATEYTKARFLEFIEVYTGIHRHLIGEPSDSLALLDAKNMFIAAYLNTVDESLRYSDFNWGKCGSNMLNLVHCVPDKNYHVTLIADSSKSIVTKLGRGQLKQFQLGSTYGAPGPIHS